MRSIFTSRTSAVAHARLIAFPAALPTACFWHGCRSFLANGNRNETSVYPDDIDRSQGLVGHAAKLKKFVAVFVVMALCAAATPVSAQFISFPNAGRSDTVTTGMQRALYYFGCYAQNAYATVNAAADGNFGGQTSRSNQALNRLRQGASTASTSVDRTRKLSGLLSAAASDSDNISDVLKFLAEKLTELVTNGSTTSYCGATNIPTNVAVKTLASSVYSKTSSLLGGGDQKCVASQLSKRYLAKIYLKSLTGKLKAAADFEAPMKVVSENFDKLFPTTITSDTELATPERMQRLIKAGGTAGTTRTVAKASLTSVETAFVDIAARYGRNVDPCATCIAISDWYMLKGIAAQTNGVLINSQNFTHRVTVDDIKLSWLRQVKDSLLIYRRLQSGWLKIVNATTQSSDALSKAREIQAARKVELDLIIRTLFAYATVDSGKDVRVNGRRLAKPAPVKHISSINWDRTMKAIAVSESKICTGFDTASISGLD